MKTRILILFFVTGFCVDECVQLNTYEKCIGIKHLQCSWTGQYCETSNNYLVGCDVHLSQQLCTKQIGDINGAISYCIFDQHCHNIYDSHSIKCTDQVNKFGCLSITDPLQLCKWTDDSCKELRANELASLNSIFAELELSASTCGLITGYLIIHHQLLWELVGYQPDLQSLAENQIESNNYNETQQLQDNYMNDRQFVWFTTSTLLSPVNLKINDVARCGCIAQEILTESRFLMLFNLSGLIRGVNHIYCNYLNMHPQNPRLTVFSNNECREVTKLQLQQNSISCTQMGRITCQRYYNPLNRCILDSKSEYQCQPTASIAKPVLCENFMGIATHFHCSSVESEVCYLTTTSAQAYCSKQCSSLFNKFNCESNTECIWLGKNLNELVDSTSSKFVVCGPKDSCDQLGLNQLYCLKLADNCQWDQINFRCKSINHIEYLFCKDCNSLYCCSSIIRYDQHCIWNNNECLNVKDSPLFSHFLSFPTNVLMNFNLCVSQTGQHNYYEIETRTCQTKGVDLYSECVLFDDPNFETDDFICNNGVNDRINKEYCLSLANSYTRWDYFKLKCVHVTNKQLPCDSLSQVNPILCSQAITEENKICLYNQLTFSCYSSQIIDIHCDTQGISQKQCLENQLELCQWTNNVCSFIWPHYINLLKCSELTLVSPRVCQMVQRGTDQCIYDNIQFGCIVNYTSLPQCNGNINQIACRQANAMCYFISNTCQDASQILNILKCNTDYITQLACISITTPGQSCYWGSTSEDSVIKCRSYSPNSEAECNQLKGIANINQCATIKIANYLSLTENQYCEVVNQECVSNTTPISDCGNERIINVHRCMGYTQGDCYFDNNKCMPLIGPPEYQQILLTTLTCDQVNMSLCTKILTPGQSCYKQSYNKCINYNPIRSYTCTQLMNYDMTIYGPQLCIRASNECFYNLNTQKCDIPAADSKFDCLQIGSSKRLCIAYTLGQCVFINGNCQPLQDLKTDCQYRNQKSCSSGGLICTWDSTKQLCSLSMMDCPANYNGESSWPMCGSSTKNCCPGQNGCVESSSNDIPCWIAISNSRCEALNKYCQWINNKCTASNYQCEDSSSIEQCVKHRSLNCVYSNNKCFEITQLNNYNCDDFDYTTVQFCSFYFPKCIYKDYTCQYVNYFGDSKQQDEEQLIVDEFTEQITQIGCIFQRSQISVFYNYWSYKFCGVDEYPLDYCDYFDDTYLPSMLYCESAPDCNFSMTLTADPFCYSDPLTCEKLPSSFCLKDIPGINCFIDDMGYCATYIGDLTCDSVADLQVNRQLCFTIMLDPSNQCYYQSSTSMCKPLNPISQIDCAGQTDIFQCTFTQTSCLNTSDLDQPCIELSDYDQNLNLFGCTQLTTGQYFFNINTYTCDTYTPTVNLLIYNCQQFNQLSCVSSILELQCVWDNEVCIERLNKQQNIGCQFRNHQACLNSSTINCLWIISTNQCVAGDSISNECDPSELCLYSEAYCVSKKLLWSKYNCYSYSTNLPDSFSRCSNLGLSFELCINHTQNLTCYWDEIRCLEANLNIIECNVTVSQQTCLSNSKCKWNNDQCINIINSTICSDFLTLHGCRLAPISCQFNLVTNQCIEEKDINYQCTNTLSYNACQNVQYEYCMWDEHQCEKWERRRYSCDQIVNKWGCYNTKMYCQWTKKCENIGSIELMPCQSIPSTFNKASCIKYSTGPCLFDEGTQKCDIKLTSSFPDALNADQSLFTQIRLTYECTQFLNQEDCIQSRIGFCDWQNNYCINCELTNCINVNCQNHNLNQCMSLSNLECAWRENNCIAWQQSENIQIVDLILVTEKCCTLQNMLIKYNFQLQSCVPLDVQNDDCLQQGLSKYACLHLSNYQCVYVNNQCQQFIMTYLTHCSQYQNINKFVCQQIPHLSCKYDSVNYKCIDVDLQSDTCETEGISKLGCSQITTQPCFWNNDVCSQFTINPSIDQCDNQTIRNSLACSLQNFYSICSFNQEYQTCQHKFNRYSLCSEPGLNKISCLQTVREPCQYVNGQCSKIMQLNMPCSELRDVNELACKMNTVDSCAYDSISNNCFYTLQNLPCSFPGLNQNSCINQEICSWNKEAFQCQFHQSQYICQLNSDACKNSEKCKYEVQNDSCIIRNCDDLTDCTGSMNGRICYQSHSKCQGAGKCEDIVNLISTSKCTDFTFSGSTCIQISNYCVSATNLNEICINSDCSNNFCKKYNSICQPLLCSDQVDCNFNEGCSIIDGICQEQSTCSVIVDQHQCINSIVDGFECQWQLTGIYDNTFHCTNAYCSLYKSSLCNGNEINQKSCFMNQFQQCVICELIVDEKTCSNSSGACKYINGQCYSILCESFIDHSQCLQSQKCYWSGKDSVCRKFCYQIILQQECEALSYECHWNTYQDKCEQGIYTDVDLSKTITITSIESSYLGFVSLFLMIFL